MPEKLRYPKTKTRTIPARDIVIAERSSNPPPARSSPGGGKGGTVVLITGTLFLGYLYFTRRLPNVLKAIQLAPKDWNLMTLSQPAGGVAPAPAKAWPRSFTLTFPAQYKAKPVEIVATDPVSCRYLVYRGTLEATGSATLAQMYVDSYCR